MASSYSAREINFSCPISLILLTEILLDGVEIECKTKRWGFPPRTAPRTHKGRREGGRRHELRCLLPAGRIGGNALPSAKDIRKILDSVGIKADNERLNKVVSELTGKNIEDVIAQGIGKLASVPAGGAAPVSAALGSAAPAAGAAPAAAEEKEGKKEELEESDDDMEFSLFD
ncbi:60S acidic ribosomal protein P2-like [Ochotona curzoniae]|uniref:60S acidic ribosomal protein P2-like n=1 Tax=Ochotona curzoniae TaxID=130825 RepID=UPI001B34CA8C|nr:60S acidic ribosomal protein P2-like [Ochotona curzoniae]